MSRGRRSGTTWRRVSRHVSLRRTPGKERLALRSSSPRYLRSFRKQEQYAATAAHLALLPTQARVVSCASASTSQGSTGPHLRSASGLRVLAGVRVHLTAMFACRLACRAWQPPSSAIYGASWRPRRPGITRSWRRWRRSSGGHLSLQSLPRLRVLAAHEERLLQRAPSATPTLLRQQNQVTFSKFIQLGAPLGLHYSQVARACPCGVYPLASLVYPAGGAPRAASSPGRSGPTQWHVSFLHLPKLVCFSCIIYLWLSPA